MFEWTQCDRKKGRKEGRVERRLPKSSQSSPSPGAITASSPQQGGTSCYCQVLSRERRLLMRSTEIPVHAAPWGKAQPGAWSAPDPGKGPAPPWWARTPSLHGLLGGGCAGRPAGPWKLAAGFTVMRTAGAGGSQHERKHGSFPWRMGTLNPGSPFQTVKTFPIIVCARSKEQKLRKYTILEHEYFMPNRVTNVCQELSDIWHY